MKQTHTYDTHILAFGPHPDDVEIWAWWIIAKSSQEWKKNVIIDLCISEMSTHWDTQTRMKESMLAWEKLWVMHRDNLLLCDTMIEDSIKDRTLVAREIRKYKPEIILLPWIKDRHPDHENASQLIKNAVFYAGLQRLDIDWLPIHKPRILAYYMIWEAFEPDFVIPLTQDQLDQKMSAFTTYTSQDKTNSRWLEYIKARHITHWHQIWTQYWEWFKVYSHAVWVEWFDDILNGFF